MRVYMQPPGRWTCLPRDWTPASVGSQTCRTSSFSPCLTKSVMSSENGRLPLSCGTSVASTPLTKTCVRKSTPPKWSRTRSFAALNATLNTRRYHSCSLGSSRRFTPESGVSMANGTRISPAHSSGRSALRSLTAYCHNPLRFCQFWRTSCGLGYSRHAFSGVIFSPHGVISWFG